MASYNRVIIMGNLTRDPEYKQLASGQAVCRLGLASNRQFRNRQSGDMVQEVCFVDVDVWGNQAESCQQYLQKGRAVLVEGRLKFDTWEDNGQRRSKHSIVADRVTFIASPQEGDDSFENESSADEQNQAPAPKASPAKKAAAPQEKPAATSGEVNVSDQKPFEDDLPF